MAIGAGTPERVTGERRDKSRSPSARAEKKAKQRISKEMKKTRQLTIQESLLGKRKQVERSMAFDNDGEIEQLTATTGKDGAYEQGGDGATAVAHCAAEDGDAREKRQRNGTGAENEPGGTGAAESNSDSGARHDEGDARELTPG